MCLLPLFSIIDDHVESVAYISHKSVLHNHFQQTTEFQLKDIDRLCGIAIMHLMMHLGMVKWRTRNTS